jgi:hypothetical protein
MASASFKHGEQLRSQIKAASAGETIRLEVGREYQGPFIIDKALTIVGQGDRSPLFAKNSPCFVILAAGVRLEHLVVAGPKQEVGILSTPNAHPRLVEVNVLGRVEMTTPEQVIDMGDLLPKQHTNCFIELDVPGPTRLRCADNSARWLRIWPEDLPAAGKHLVQVICDAKVLGNNAIAVGKLDLEVGTEKRTYWVTVNVLAEVPPKLLSGPIALEQAGHPIRFGESFLIGKDRLIGAPNAGSLAERQAIVLKEATTNTWALFTPWQTALPTQLNGRPLAPGQRVLLQAGDTISVERLALKVIVPPANGIYSADKALVDLGACDAASEQSVQIRYNGAGRDRARIYTTLPWLKAAPAEIELVQGEIREVKLQPALGGISLPPGKQRERSAILVHGSRETLSLDVSYEPQAAQILPRVEGTCSFGLIGDWTKGNVTVMVANGGSKDWQPTITLDQDWLAAERPALTIPAGQSAPLVMRLTDRAAKLPCGVEHTARVTLEGAGVKLPLQFSVRLRDPNVVLELNPALVDLTISDWSGSLPSGALQVTNLTDHPLVINALSALNWLTVTPSQMTCPPGQPAALLVQLNPAEAKGLRPKLYNLPDAIVIKAEGKERLVGLKVNILQAPPAATGKTATPAAAQPLDFSFSVSEIDLGTILGWTARMPEQKIQIRHNQPQAITLTVCSGVPWLLVRPDHFACPPEGGTFSVEVARDQAAKTLRDKTYQLSDGITIEGGGVVKNLLVRLKVATH